MTPEQEYEFNKWLITLPPPVQVNILEALERGESYTKAAWSAAYAQGVAQERERCAYIYDRWSGVGDVVARAIAAAIRRGDD